jgi:hypothetical protein
MLRRPPIGLLLVAMLAMAACAWAPPASGSESEPAPPAGVSLAFELPATNGYTATVIAAFNPKMGKSAAIFAFRRKGGSVTYATTSAAVSASTVEAHFGSLGEVDAHLVPTEGTTTERSECGGKPVTFPSGRWEGTIRLRGEGGFASVDASSAEEVVAPFLDILCIDETTEGIGGHSPGALLELKRRHGAEALELSVRKNRRVGPTRISAHVTERRGRLGIERSVSAVAPSRAFDFEFPPGLATAEPPKPFSGSLTLTRRPGSSPVVKGNLKVDFPGRADVPVLGAGSVRASLVRAVLNPSHPF